MHGMSDENRKRLAELEEQAEFDELDEEEREELRELRSMVREARRRLRALENREVAAQSGGDVQPDLFIETHDAGQTRIAHPAVVALQQIDPDALTPREALERLYDLRRMLKE